MLSDILLTVCPPFSPKMPPMCLAYLAAYLKMHDLRADIYDMNIDVYTAVDAHLKSLWNLEISNEWNEKNILNGLYKKDAEKELAKLVDKLLDFNTKVIGFSVNSGNRYTTIKIIEALKGKDADRFIVVGGMGCFYADERKIFPTDLIDAYVIGEGEETLVELLRNIKAGKDLTTIAGVIIPSAEEAYCKRELIANLDSIAYPDYAQFNLADYETEMIPLLASRGCINKCSFCSDHHFWQGKYRVRSAEQVFAEIRYNAEILGKDNFMFYDLLLNGNISQLDRLAELLMGWERRIFWMGDMLASPKLTKETFFKMKEAGCYALCFGIESGSDKVLGKMRKNFKVAGAKQNLKDASDVGIACYVNIIVGFPGEGEAEFLETVAFLKESNGDIAGINNINSCNLVTNTDLFNHYADYNITLTTASDKLSWSCGEDNTEQIRQERVAHLRKVVATLEKYVYNDNVVDMEKDGQYFNNYNPWENINTPDILIINAPQGSIKMPSIALNTLSECLGKTKFNYDLIDLNMMLYGELSMKLREYWEPHKVYLWLEKESFLTVYKQIKQKFDKYIQRLLDSKAKQLLFVVNCFNLQATKHLIFVLQEKGFKNEFICFLEETFLGEEGIVFLKSIKSFTSYQELCKYFSVNMTELETVFPAYAKSNLRMYTTRMLPVNVLDFFNNLNAEKIVLAQILYHLEHNHIAEFMLIGFAKAEAAFIDKLAALLLEQLAARAVKLTIVCDDPCQFPKVLLAKFKKAGMNSLILNMESAADHILQQMGKKAGSLDYEKMINTCKELGIKVLLSISVGFHGETKSDFEETLAFLEKNAKSIYKMYRVDKHICVNSDCYMKNNKLRAVIYPVVPADTIIDWQDIFGNTDTLRSARLFKLLDVLQLLNIEVLSSNINYSSENKSKTFADKAPDINACNAAVSEIVAYKDNEILKLDMQKNKTIAQIAKESASKFISLEKTMISEKNKFETHLENITKIKDNEISDLVAAHEKRLKKVVNEKNIEIEKLVKDAVEREKDVIEIKDAQISQLVKQHEIDMANLVKEKDREIAKLASVSDMALSQKDTVIAQLRLEIEKIYQTKLFKIQSALLAWVGKSI